MPEDKVEGTTAQDGYNPNKKTNRYVENLCKAEGFERDKETEKKLRNAAGADHAWLYYSLMVFRRVSA